MATQKKPKANISSQAVMDELKNLAMLSGGVVIGSLGGKMIDKLLKVDPAAVGFSVLALARPIVLLSAGAAGNIMLKDQNLKLLATGVGAAGILSSVKIFLKKDLLAGLSDFSFSGMGEVTEPTIYREPVTLSIERYNPDLPALSEAINIEQPAMMQHSNPVTISETSISEDLSYIEII